MANLEHVTLCPPFGEEGVLASAGNIAISLGLIL